MINTKHRVIKTKIPAPRTLKILKRLSKIESRSIWSTSNSLEESKRLSSL